MRPRPLRSGALVAAVTVAAALVGVASATAGGPAGRLGSSRESVHVARPALWAGGLHAILRTDGQRFGVGTPAPAHASGTAPLLLLAGSLGALAALPRPRTSLTRRSLPTRAPPPSSGRRPARPSGCRCPHCLTAPEGAPCRSGARPWKGSMMPNPAHAFGGPHARGDRNQAAGRRRPT